MCGCWPRVAACLQAARLPGFQAACPALGMAACFSPRECARLLCHQLISRLSRLPARLARLPARAPLQERFDVDIKPLPEVIDASTYMNAA